ncbi:MAG: ParB N-terminal domain-containing protein [Blastomonas sp.]
MALSIESIVLHERAEIMELPVEAISQGERIGFFWPEKAAALGALMARDGQSQPILVHAVRGGQWRLVAGLHRLEGARTAGLATIRAIEVSGSAAELRLIEASENMHRRDFGPIEKAMFIRALADVYEGQVSAQHEGLTQQQIAIRARWETDRNKVQLRDETKAELEAEHTAATIAAVYGWQPQVAQALGTAPRTLRDYLFIHRTIIAPFGDLAEALARTPLGGQRKAVMEIGAIASQAQRRNVIELIIKDIAVQSVAQAKIWAGVKDGPQRNVTQGQSKYMDNAGSNLDRLTPAAWKQFAPRLAQAIKPSALREVRDAIDARLAALDAKEGGHG